MRCNVGDPFVMGVNYWPRKSAMYMWTDAMWNPDEIREDFALLRNVLGARGVVRVFLRWEDFQRSIEPGGVDGTRLAMLKQVADMALDAGLLLDVTFFTGHMSGPNWVPEWMLLPEDSMPPHVVCVVSGDRVRNCGYRNPYTDEAVISAECELLTHVVGSLAGHGAIGLWNLSNEPDLVAIPSREQARLWVKRMVDTIRAIDATTPITVGMHAPSLGEDVGFTCDLFAGLDISVIHGYPMYACSGLNPWAKAPLDARFVPFLAAMTTALSGVEGRPTLAEEFGGCTQPPGVASGFIEFQSYGSTRKQFMASEEDFAQYLEETLENLLKVGASGAMIWCFADYHMDLWDKPPCKDSYHERFFGMVRSDNSLKPHAYALQRFAQKNHAIRPRVFKTSSPNHYYLAPEVNSRIEYARFLAELETESK